MFDLAAAASVRNELTSSKAMVGSNSMPGWDGRRRRRRSHCRRMPTLKMMSCLLLMLWCFDPTTTTTRIIHALDQPRKITRTSSSSNNAPWRNGLKNGLASAGAAACVKILLQPIDAIKTVQQYESHSVSVLAAFRQLYERRQLYAGLGVTVVGSMPSVALYFGVYSYCKQRLLQHTEWGKHHPTASIAISAAIGNTVASFSRVPYETVKQKLQAGIYESTWAVLVDLANRPGLARELLFPAGGVWVQMLRDIPYAVVTLLLYESLQQRFHVKDQRQVDGTDGAPKNNNKSKGVDFLLGGIAGGIGSWVTNPMDVIKTRIQTGTSDSIVGCLMAVWREGGLNALFRGSIPRLLHKIPANACFFLFYETFKRLLKVQQGGATGTKLPSSSTSSTAEEEVGETKTGSTSVSSTAPPVPIDS
jgi:solute carrier family 25 (mitochondrial S-adenosylmethionine transporter), member 26